MNSYTKRNRKRIKLPSGAEIVIAKLNTYTEPFITKGPREDEQSAGVKLAKFCLTNPGNGLFHFDGDEARIVDKEKAGPGEITIADLDQEDANQIVNEVIAFSGLDKAGQEARKTFPEGQAPRGEPSPAGNDVSHPADGTIKTAAG